jgi:hypothetical protein
MIVMMIHHRPDYGVVDGDGVAGDGVAGAAADDDGVADADVDCNGNSFAIVAIGKKRRFGVAGSSKKPYFL